MDYKSRHHVPLNWTYDDFEQKTHPAPYDCSSAACFFEIVSPDGLTTFLLNLSIHELDADPAIFYGIEAARNCPMRKAFEWGEISWPDYWSHKGWLLKIECPWNPGLLKTSYITPDQMDQTTHDELERLKGRSPYDLKRRILELGCDLEKAGTHEAVTAEREYRQFMTMYGHRFAKLAA